VDEATQRILPRHSAVIGTLAMLAAKEEVTRADHDTRSLQALGPPQYPEHSEVLRASAGAVQGLLAGRAPTVAEQQRSQIFEVATAVTP
jgi:hypothetical protein